MPATKRKSNVVDLSDDEPVVLKDLVNNVTKHKQAVAEPATKKARVTEAKDGDENFEEKPKPKGRAKKVVETRKWDEITLDGEEEGEVPVFDDCNEIRRKIRLLQKTPGFKITHWLRDIGGVNSNSFNRFMKLSGPQGGAENNTYEAAYIYFEKVRIAENKKKTAKRESNERMYPHGLPLEGAHRRRYVWVRA